MIKPAYYIWAIAFFVAACSPKVTKNNKGAFALKIMTYNIHHAGPPSKPDFIDVDAVAAAISREHPDLVALQEVDRLTKRSGSIDEAKLIAGKTGMHYRFFKAIDHDGGDYGLAILSRYPINNEATLNLPQVMKGEKRILAYADINLSNGTSIVFADTHLDAQRADSNRVVQIQAIMSALSLYKKPVILCGDLNSEPSAKTIALLDHQFKRSCTADCGATIPVINPKKTIDFIALKNATWPVMEHRVIDETYASDHRPVVATYQIR
jgi:endonuclease/exonuclease/phosphatase family metal-dependent hydrolase